MFISRRGFIQAMPALLAAAKILIMPRVVSDSKQSAAVGTFPLTFQFAFPDIHSVAMEEARRKIYVPIIFSGLHKQVGQE